MVFGVPVELGVKINENIKRDKYISRELKIWNKKVTLILIEIGAFGISLQKNW